MDPATAAVIGTIAGALIGGILAWIAAERSGIVALNIANSNEENRYREWLVERRFLAYNDILKAYDRLWQESLALGTNEFNNASEIAFERLVTESFKVIDQHWVAIDKHVANAWFRFCCSCADIQKLTQSDPRLVRVAAYSTLFRESETEVKEAIAVSLSKTKLEVFHTNDRAKAGIDARALSEEFVDQARNTVG